jgi:hypothetical protein
MKKINYIPVENLVTNLDENIVFIKKTRGRPKKYSSAEEARLAKIKKTVEAAKRRKGGEGIIKNIIKPTVPRVTRAIKKAVPMAPRAPTFRPAFRKFATNLLNTTNSVIYGREDYPPKVRDIISKYGDKNITNITLGRTPLGAPLMAALQIASGNTFSQKLDDTPYDKLFHLFMCVELNSTDKIVLEKNEVINADIGCKNPKDTETREINSSDIPTGLTLNEALEKTQERMGKDYFTYSAKSNNCQDFIVNFLTANNLGNETDKSWVKQETKVLFEGNDRLRKIANTFTDIGARFNVLTQGAGFPLLEKVKGERSSLRLKSNNIYMNPWIEYVKSYAKKHNIKFNEALKDPKMKEGYKKKGGKINILKAITNVGKKLGEPFKKTTGVNPFTMGYDLGHDVIAPELKKAIKGKGMPTSKDSYIAELYNQANLGSNGLVKL